MNQKLFKFCEEIYMFVFGIALLFLTADFYWLLGKLFSFYGMKFNKWSNCAIRILLIVVIGIICFYWGFFGIIIIHLMVVSTIIEIVVLLVERIFRLQQNKKIGRILRIACRSGILTVGIVSLVVFIGCMNMVQITKTEYIVLSEKLSTDYRVVLITDTHYDTIQKPEAIKDMVKEISVLQPDFVVLGGDIVEENTSKEAMEEAFRVLSTIKNRFGIYYVYGNHDRQPYTEKRTYTDDELNKAIEASGITILKDRHITVNQELVLVGRDDAAWGNQSMRASSENVLKGSKRNLFTIILDHQPVDIEENAKLGVDLQLSGHTHAGQIFPIGFLNSLSGTLNYGEYKQGNMKVIVSSGAAGWGFPIRTQGKCEYVVVNLESQ
ncbi:metallophosphoesterase [Schaedlerella arabinosiphila]|nr:metallophosphoesterase [Schaedlerella arabinosiphila]